MINVTLTVIQSQVTTVSVTTIETPVPGAEKL